MRRYFHSFKFVKPKKKVEIPLYQWVGANQISLAIPWRGRKGENISNSSSIPELKRGGIESAIFDFAPPSTKATFQGDWKKKKKRFLSLRHVEYNLNAYFDTIKNNILCPRFFFHFTTFL